jgi:hypothetical protein
VLLRRHKHRLGFLGGGLFNEALSVHNGIKEQKELAYQRQQQAVFLLLSQEVNYGRIVVQVGDVRDGKA